MAALRLAVELHGQSMVKKDVGAAAPGRGRQDMVWRRSSWHGVLLWTKLRGG
jgi:hypothetical protein